jgi:hypothetical protein
VEERHEEGRKDVKGIDGLVVTFMVSIHPLHATLTIGRSALDGITLHCIALHDNASPLSCSFSSLVMRSLIIILYWSPSEEALGTGWDT